MPNVEHHKPGTFCWFELATSDHEAAKQFYTSLFGWTFNDFPMGPSMVYSIFQLQGRDVAATYTLNAEQKAHGVPPHWLLYVTTENADAAASKAAENGATVMVPPFDVMEQGRMAVLMDPAGAAFAVWQPKNHPGTGMAGVNGTVCWADLNTPDIDKAKTFYQNLFGWHIDKSEGDPTGYTHIKNGEEFIGGIPPAEYRNPNAPPHWMIYFLMADCAASSQKAQQLGAQTLMGPQEIPNVGRMAILQDPQSAVFALFEPKSR
ncbi:MAG: VOC family protein [Acidobacteriaceae bacterium]|nr:VOC family protein [Acidobacteriaceae bacterium]